MLSHVHVGVNVFERAFTFYAAIMETLGYHFAFPGHRGRRHMGLDVAPVASQIQNAIARRSQRLTASLLGVSNATSVRYPPNLLAIGSEGINRRLRQLHLKHPVLRSTIRSFAYHRATR